MFNLTALKQLPKEVEIKVPSVRDDEVGFYNLWKRLFELDWQQSNKYYIVLNFSTCNYVGVNLTALIGSFVSFVRRKLINSTIHIDTKSMNQQVYIKLRNMGLLESLDKLDGQGFRDKTEDIIPYTEFLVTAKEDDILGYLEKDWLGKNRLNFSEEVKTAVLSSLWEIYANAFEHSNTHQVQSCGSYDSKTKTLSLLVGDSGKGIVASIRDFLGVELSQEDALEWALVKGNSTYTANLKEAGKAQPRGLGLHLLTQLVDINEGCMEIYTDSIFYVRKDKISTFTKVSQSVQGSWVRLTLQCKHDVVYYFSDEKVPEYF